MNEIGERIKTLLDYRGMSQKELAEKAGLTEAAVCRYVKGERTPRAVTVVSLARALDVRPSELLGDDGSNEEDLDSAVRLVARKAGDLTERQKLEILSALARL